MTTSPIQPPRRTFQTFMDFPLCEDPDSLGDMGAHVAILGIPYGDPYNIDEVTNDQTNAPTAIRRESENIIMGLDHYDFDIGGTLFDGKNINVVDVGDITAEAQELGLHYPRAEATVRKILAAGALPVVFGGDHGIPIPVMRALDDIGETITLIQVDAHIDWRDNVNGVREGYSSPIRRASEMDHIGNIYQLGIRSSGSARTEEVEAALAYGSTIVTAHEIHETGMQAVLDRIPDGGHYYLTVDLDGLDPGIAPAVMARTPGGLLYHHMRTLVQGLVSKGKLVGMDLNEIAPKYDLGGVTCGIAGRMVLMYIGAAVRAGYFD